MKAVALLKRFGLAFLLLSQFGLTSAASIAQDQMMMLQNLPPAQREMAKRLLGDFNASGGMRQLQKDTRTKSKDTTDQKTQQQDTEESTQQAEPVWPRLKGGDTIVVYFEDPKPDPEDKNYVPVEPELVLQHRKMLFKLDKYGVLEFPNVGRIPLAGLNEMEAAARVALEPEMVGYAISVVRLPLEPIGKEALKPFGYDLFENKQEEMLTEGNLDLPVPLDYVVGPGDTLYVQLFGKENREYELEISREGNLLFPDIGSVPVAGLTFKELKKTLEQRVAKQFIGMKAYVTMGALRSIQVFLAGEVARPGAYTVSALSTVTGALLAAGGIKEGGSLRNLQVKRDGKLVTRFDLYDLLLKGDNRNDVRLQSGDVVFVPLVRETVGVSGEVRRPAIYELAGEQSVGDIISLAGGVLPGALPERARIERVNPGKGSHVLNVDLNGDGGRGQKVHNGDLVMVGGLPERMENVVFLRGHVFNPRPLQWHQGMRLTDAIASVHDLKTNADLDYVVVKREAFLGDSINLLSTSLRDAFAFPGRENDLVLQPRDEIVVFDMSPNRHLLIKPIIEQLQIQATKVEPARIVRISGEVRAPGTYPLEDKMRISDLLRAGGYLKESAYSLKAELTRYVTNEEGSREIRHVNVDLAAVLGGAEEADLVLQPYDQFTIKQLPQWEEQNLVEVRGEVRFPGKYPIRRGETLDQLLARAGGLTEFAYPEGAVFTRDDLRQREQERMDTMANNLEAELAVASLKSDVSQQEGLEVSRRLLAQLRSTQAVGRLVINLQDHGSETYDVVLKGGDKLYVPARMQEVTVMGEVYHATSHLYNEDFSWKDYVDSSGGATPKADEDRIYVIRANGAVVSTRRGFLNRSVESRPGDTIVVPLDAERVSTLKLVTDVSQIMYQLGLAAAAWNTIGILK